MSSLKKFLTNKVYILHKLLDNTSGVKNNEQIEFLKVHLKNNSSRFYTQGIQEDVWVDQLSEFADLIGIDLEYYDTDDSTIKEVTISKD